MIETAVWTLPGGYSLPWTLETVTLLEYRLEPGALPANEAERLLEGESLRQTQAELVAGTVETGSVTVRKKGDIFGGRAAWNCLELISRTQPFELFGEDEANGQTDQRGTN